MSTVIRLKRGGRAHAPFYRIVVTDNRSRPTGRVIEELGYYHPCARPETRAEVNAAKALEWLNKGAKPSPTVRKVLSDFGVMKAKATGATIEPQPEAAPEETATTATESGPTEG